MVARLWEGLVRLGRAAGNDQANVEIRSFGNIHRSHMQESTFKRLFGVVNSLLDVGPADHPDSSSLH